MKRIAIIAALMATVSLACGQKPLTLPPLIIIGTTVLNDTNALPLVEVKTRADGSLILTGPEPAPAPAPRGKSRLPSNLAEPTIKPCYET